MHEEKVEVKFTILRGLRINIVMLLVLNIYIYILMLITNLLSCGDED